MFYALETFCETLGEDVLPYLPPLMQNLLQLLQLPGEGHQHVRELALSAVGALGNAAREGLVPYFEPVMMALRQYLLAERSGENGELQVQALGECSGRQGERERRERRLQVQVLGECSGRQGRGRGENGELQAHGE